MSIGLLLSDWSAAVMAGLMKRGPGSFLDWSASGQRRSAVSTFCEGSGVYHARPPTRYRRKPAGLRGGGAPSPDLALTDVATRIDDLDRLRTGLPDWHLWEDNSGTLRPLLPGDSPRHPFLRPEVALCTRPTWTGRKPLTKPLTNRADLALPGSILTPGPGWPAPWSNLGIGAGHTLCGPAPASGGPRRGYGPSRRFQ